MNLTSNLLFFTLLLSIGLLFGACQEREQKEEQANAANTPSLNKNSIQELVRTISPLQARNGSLRFVEPRLDTPLATPYLLNRLSDGKDSVAVRLALSRFLPRTRGKYALRVRKLYQNEQNENIRKAFIGAMRLSIESKPALALLELGLTDSSAAVRSHSAFSIGRRKDGLELQRSLMASLQDKDSRVQAASAKALGQLHSEQGFEEISQLFKSHHPHVRLESLRALSRIHSARAANLPVLTTLAIDPDNRIRSTAEKVKLQAY